MKNIFRLSLIVCIGLLTTSFFFFEKGIQKEYEIVVPNLKIPWGFTFLPDNSILITEKEGELIHFKNGKKYKIDFYFMFLLK